jgi:hypothetical protein
VIPVVVIYICKWANVLDLVSENGVKRTTTAQKLNIVVVENVPRAANPVELLGAVEVVIVVM